MRRSIAVYTSQERCTRWHMLPPPPANIDNRLGLAFPGRIHLALVGTDANLHTACSCCSFTPDGHLRERCCAASRAATLTRSGTQKGCSTVGRANVSPAPKASGSGSFKKQSVSGVGVGGAHFTASAHTASDNNRPTVTHFGAGARWEGGCAPRYAPKLPATTTVPTGNVASGSSVRSAASCSAVRVLMNPKFISPTTTAAGQAAFGIAMATAEPTFARWRHRVSWQARRTAPPPTVNATATWKAGW
mmetsp:Transcript_30832/g.98359  ORF Transcript_30832/g.98359 Transcript_30832/m.98359 type:complete len:247 (-) Transcript_30832:36-776(-)